MPKVYVAHTCKRVVLTRSIRKALHADYSKCLVHADAHATRYISTRRTKVATPAIHSFTAGSMTLQVQ